MQQIAAIAYVQQHIFLAGDFVSCNPSRAKNNRHISTAGRN
jgi:hypothetical protein